MAAGSVLVRRFRRPGLVTAGSFDLAAKSRRGMRSWSSGNTLFNSGTGSPMSEQTMIRVILVDDHPVVRFGLAAIIGLQPDMVVVAEAGSGEEACSITDRQEADVVLMDLRLPGMSGAEAIRALKKAHAKLRFIVLTTYDGDEDIHKALEAGADAYLLKAMSHDELASAIRTVHSGRKFIPPSVSRSLSERPP